MVDNEKNVNDRLFDVESICNDIHHSQSDVQNQMNDKLMAFVDGVVEDKIKDKIKDIVERNMLLDKIDETINETINNAVKARVSIAKRELDCFIADRLESISDLVDDRIKDALHAINKNAAEPAAADARREESKRDDVQVEKQFDNTRRSTAKKSSLSLSSSSPSSSSLSSPRKNNKQMKVKTSLIVPHAHTHAHTHAHYTTTTTTTTATSFSDYGLGEHEKCDFMKSGQKRKRTVTKQYVADMISDRKILKCKGELPNSAINEVKSRPVPKDGVKRSKGWIYVEEDDSQAEEGGDEGDSCEEFEII
jgi:hypothetical protein